MKPSDPAPLSRHATLVVLLVIWGLLLLVPAWIAHAREPDNWRIPFYWLTPVGGFAAMFFLNWGLLVPRLLYRNRMGAYLGVNLAWGWGIVVVVEGFYVLALGEPFHIGWSDLAGVLTYFVIYSFLCFAAIALRSIQRSRQIEAEREQMQSMHTRMELERLKSQLNPHFLFNSLNNISALSVINPEGAQEAIGRLSSMLRYVLYDTGVPQVSLRQDMDFVADYVALMSLRYTEALKVTTTADPRLDPESPVPPMLFISLVENAFKYGANSTSDSRIEIAYTLIGEDRLALEVINTVAPPPLIDAKSKGLGLLNLRERLCLLFASDFTLSYGKDSRGLYRAYLEIPLPCRKNLHA